MENLVMVESSNGKYNCMEPTQILAQLNISVELFPN